MKLGKLLVMLLCSISWQALPAEVPYTFTAGEAANAEQVNANFDALVTQIEQLQAQLAALQADAGPPTLASIPGTYDYVELDIQVAQQTSENFAISGGSGTGTVVLNADGTGTVTSTDNERQLTFFSRSETVGNGTGGTTPIYSTQVQHNSYPGSESGNFTWTFSNNVLTVTDEEVMTFFPASGRIFVHGGADAEGGNRLLIVIRR